jgi:hypothetical protein
MPQLFSAVTVGEARGRWRNPRRRDLWVRQEVARRSAIEPVRRWRRWTGSIALVGTVQLVDRRNDLLSTQFFEQVKE